MASIYDVVCLTCGEIHHWCKYYPPIDRCDLCGSKLTKYGDWDEEKAVVFGVWSTGENINKTSTEARRRFFEDRKVFRFKLMDGRICSVTLEDRQNMTFRFTLKSGNKKISLIYENDSLSTAVSSLRSDGQPTVDGLLRVEFDGATFEASRAGIQNVLDAVRENITPEIYTLLNAE